MTKGLRKTLFVIVVLAVALVALVACSDYDFTALSGAQADKPTESNSGLVVKQGDYYYFINGFVAVSEITEKKHNEYGEVLKGSIMRTKKTADGWSAAEVVAPKVVYSPSKTQGFSIYGEYIYYPSPSIATDTKGNLQTSYTDYMRCKVDGTGTEKLATLDGNVTSYKFTPNALIYQQGSDLMSITYADKRTNTLVEDVTSAIFPISSDYNFKETTQDFVYYTKDSDEAGAGYNEVFAINGDGSKNIKLMTKGTFGEGSKNAVTLKEAAVEADGSVALYYTRTDNTLASSSKALGLFGIKLAPDAFADDYKVTKEKEKQFTNNPDLTYTKLTFDTGVLINTSTVNGNQKLYIPYIENGLTVAEKEISFEYPSGITLTIKEFVKVNGTDFYMYYTSSSSLNRILMTYDEATRKITVKQGSMAEAVAGNIKSDWLTIERIGDDFFYMNSSVYNYVYTFNVSSLTGDEFDPTVGLERDDMTMIGKMTEDDQEKYEDMLEEEKEEENK